MNTLFFFSEAIQILFRSDGEIVRRCSEAARQLTTAAAAMYDSTVRERASAYPQRDLQQKVNYRRRCDT